MGNSTPLFGIAPEEITGNRELTLSWSDGVLELADSFGGDPLLGPDLPELGGDMELAGSAEEEQTDTITVAMQ